MNQELKPWRLDDRQAFADLCNATNHAYLTMDFPVSMRQADARWWLEYAVGNDGLRVSFVRFMWMAKLLVKCICGKWNKRKGKFPFLLKERMRDRAL